MVVEGHEPRTRLSDDGPGGDQSAQRARRAGLRAVPLGDDTEDEALDVMAAWGFTYKSQIIWDKEDIGLGYWTREQHEVLLIGTRGNVPAPAPGEQLESVTRSPRGPHGEKPPIFAAWIEVLYPTTPKLEMFARGGRERGWDRWGNEVEERA